LSQILALGEEDWNARDQFTVAIGTERWMAENQIPVDNPVAQVLAAQRQAGNISVLCAVNGKSFHT
jgi:hypothetical protein